MDNFIAIRNGLLEHIRQGKLCPTDLGIYTFLHLTADWGTGISYTCASGIAAQFSDPSLKELIQKALRRLRGKGYINYRSGNGHRGCYQILIHKYEPTVGTLCGMRLNAFANGSLAKPVYEQKNSGGAVEPQSGHSGDTVETPIQDLKTLQDVQDRSGGAKAPSRRKADREVPMPEGFQPKDSHRLLAAKLGVDLQSAFEKFCDDRISKGCKYVDWNRALNTWLRNEADFRRGKAVPIASKPNGKAGGTSSALDYQAELLRQADRGVQQ